MAEILDDDDGGMCHLRSQHQRVTLEFKTYNHAQMTADQAKLPKMKLRVRGLGDCEGLSFNPKTAADKLVLRSNEMRAFVSTDEIFDLKFELTTHEEDWQPLRQDIHQQSNAKRSKTMDYESETQQST